ncbi:cyclic nucleotide-binding domain-containing protein [Marinilongibacter aquaticus]|uniref:cyclic nucleotide-binding domain-containing protein n=1 Tax=Marinilongibacter aquaticus TaxID=2975157 RepID=UPI0021BD8C2B|nr:cyclic nucleotide-binding domain-containing protein [Marinilongibacter aquaticus]UBM57446.1 cyclic nucleotide-binding domain-containing protein [Marinilongibacter aquaticus]
MTDYPFLNQLDADLKTLLLHKAREKTLQPGDTVTSQYDLGQHFYFLVEGAVEFSIKVEQEMEELTVGHSQRPFTPVGWSGFREPYRYATTVRCTQESRFVCWTHAELRDIFSTSPAESMAFLAFIVQQSQPMLQQTRQILALMVPVAEQSFLDLIPEQSLDQTPEEPVIDVLKRSPFFEVFDEDTLLHFAALGETQALERGEKLFVQDNLSHSFDMLLQGKAVLVYSEDRENTQLDKRIVQHAGYLLGTGCFSMGQKNTVSCVALLPSSVFRIPFDKLADYLKNNPWVGMDFYIRLLWYFSNRLRSARAKLIRIRFDGEISAVKNLIEQNCTQLDVLSSLHKVPHLLRSPLTLQDALALLHTLRISGSSLEKRLAASALDILTEVVRENEFYNGLSQVYSLVVNAPKEWPHDKVRKACAEAFIQVFEKTQYALQGWENLPDEPAIFIYNHLENHVYNTLPNNFQLTLDSHFISSVVLNKKYGNPGVRVVRVPRGEEYGHQYYYERLGHIPVYTNESAIPEGDEQYKKQQRGLFYQLAAEYLEKGTSIMIAPEGQSSSTEQSPSAFKAGAFLLAARMKKEPLIVPVAVANFDKRLNRTTFSVVIKEPFRISELVENPEDRGELAAFLKNYTRQYKTYIREAQELAKTNPWAKLLNPFSDGI